MAVNDPIDHSCRDVSVSSVRCAAVASTSRINQRAEQDRHPAPRCARSSYFPLTEKA